MQQIRIAGDTVQVIEESVIRSMDLAEWVDGLTTPETWWGPFPHSTRFIYWSGTDLRVVCEVPPGLKPLVVGSDRNPTTHTFTVSMPWQYWVFSFAHDRATYDPRLWWSPKRLSEPTQPLWWADLPNIGEEGWVCTGTMHYPQNVDEVEDFINAYYTNPATNHLGWTVPPPFESYRQWEVASAKDPMLGVRLGTFLASADGYLIDRTDATIDAVTRVDVNSFIETATVLSHEKPVDIYPNLTIEQMQTAVAALNRGIAAKREFTHATLTPGVKHIEVVTRPDLDIDYSLYAEVPDNDHPERAFGPDRPDHGPHPRVADTTCSCEKCEDCGNTTMGDADEDGFYYCETCWVQHVYPMCNCSRGCQSSVGERYATTCWRCDNGDHDYCERNADCEYCNEEVNRDLTEPGYVDATTRVRYCVDCIEHADDLTRCATCKVVLDLNDFTEGTSCPSCGTPLPATE